jgi:hypothetical protein
MEYSSGSVVSIQNLNVSFCQKAAHTGFSSNTRDNPLCTTCRSPSIMIAFPLLKSDTYLGSLQDL